MRPKSQLVRVTNDRGLAQLVMKPEDGSWDWTWSNAVAHAVIGCPGFEGTVVRAEEVSG